MRVDRIAICMISLAIASSGLASSPALSSAQQDDVSDGRWWTRHSSNERGDFVAGWMNCYYFDHRGPFLWASDISMDSVVNLLSHYYESDSARLSASLSHAILAVASLRDGVSTLPSAVRPPEDRGWDGLDWKQMSGGEQLAYVEGYMQCHQSFAFTVPHVRFARTPGDYVRRTSMWYRFDRQTGDIDGDRESTSIGAVLHRVAH